MKLGLSGWKKRSATGSSDADADAALHSATAGDAVVGQLPTQPVPEPGPPPDEPWDELAGEPVLDQVPMRGDSVVIDDPNTEPGLLYIEERVLTSAITPVHIATQDRPGERGIEAVERLAQAARLLVCDIQECHDQAEPLAAYALGPIVRDASRVAVELQSVLAAMKKMP